LIATCFFKGSKVSSARTTIENEPRPIFLMYLRQKERKGKRERGEGQGE